MIPIYRFMAGMGLACAACFFYLGFAPSRNRLLATALVFFITLAAVLLLGWYLSLYLDDGVGG